MDVEQYKKAVKDAIAAEVDAREFYLSVSERIKDDYLTELFLNFSNEEKKHEIILSALLEQGKIEASTFGEAKDCKVSETIELPEVSEDMNLKDAIGLAMKNEEIAMKNYQTLADNCDDPELKGVFNSLASMELNHKGKLEDAFVDVAYPEVW